MNRRSYQEWFRQTWHPSEEDLLQYLDGELPPKTATKVRAHLDACWACRAQSEKMAQAILAFMDYRHTVLTPSAEAIPQGQSRFEAKLRRLASESFRPSWISRIFSSGWQKMYLLPSALRLAAGAALSLLVALAIWRLSSAPMVSAKELLDRVEKAESARIVKVASAVVYQKVQVRRHSSAARNNEENFIWEIWNDTNNRRFQQRVIDRQGPRFVSTQSSVAPDLRGADEPDSLPSVLAELNQIFQANHMDIQRPLSPGSYDRWRVSMSRRTETVNAMRLPDGSKGLKLTTSPAGPHRADGIVQAELTVRAEDWHPVEENLRVQRESGTQNYQLTETAFEVVALNALPPVIFAEISHGTTGFPSLPATLSVAAPLAGASELRESQLEARFALHRLNACLGEPIETILDKRGQVEVRGLVENKQRKEELQAALASVPRVAVGIQTYAEAEKSPPSSLHLSQALRNKNQAPHSASSPVEVEVGKLPIQDRLERYFAQKGLAGEANPKIAELSNRVLSLSESVLAEAWALRRLAEQYPPAEFRQVHPPARRMLESMVHDHINGLKGQFSQMRELLQPVLSAMADENKEVMEEPSGVPLTYQSLLPGRNDVRWNLVCLEVFRRVEPLCEMVRNLFAGVELSNQEAETAIRESLKELQQSEGWFRGLETRLARDFSASPNAFSSETK